MNRNEPLIKLDNAETRIRDRRILKNTSWILEEGESWAVTGPNGSGKTSFTRLLTGELPVVSGTMTLRDDLNPARDIALVSFETQKRIFKAESRKDDARIYSGDILDFTSVADFLSGKSETDNIIFESSYQPQSIKDHQENHGCGINISKTEELTTITNTDHILQRNITKLSTGEFRKVLITKALLSNPRILILDEPMEGLDAASRKQLSSFIDNLIKKGFQVIFVTHLLKVIPESIKNVICLKNNRVIASGKRTAVLKNDFIENLYKDENNKKHHDISLYYSTAGHKQCDEIVKMQNVSVKYGDLVIFDNISWTVKKGEKWVVKGPNGSGKSTLLSLITGDNQQAYANEIYIFGKKRGSGESIWDIKHHIGFISSEFQIKYQKDITVKDVVLSGFFDSTGLYRRPSSSQTQKAMAWLSITGLHSKHETLFTHLSFGEQKLVLIARAMVKSPELLILDEPCQGLDPLNRKKIISIMETIGQIKDSTIIYVTHHNDEIPQCFNCVLHL